MTANATPRLRQVASGRVHPASEGDTPWRFERTATAKIRLETQEEELERRVRHGGKAKVKALLKFALRYYRPVAILMVYYFAITASFSYFVPSKLCRKQAISYAGSLTGLDSCVNGGWSVDEDVRNPNGYLVFWLLFHVAQFSFLAMWAGVLAYVMFGKSFTKPQRAWVLFWTLATGIGYTVACGYYQKPFSNLYLVAFMVCTTHLTYQATGLAAANYVRDKMMVVRWVVLFQVAGIISASYLLIIKKIVTLRASEAFGGFGLAIVRLFVHPVIWYLLSTWFRSVVRHVGSVPNLRQMSFTLFPAVYKSVFAYFLLIQLTTALMVGGLQMDNVGSVVVLNFIFACVEVSNRLVDREKDGILLKLIYGDRAKDALMSLPDHESMCLNDNIANSIGQTLGLLMSATIFTFGRVAIVPGVPPDNSLIWTNTALQLITQVVADVTVLAVEGKFHKFDWEEAFPKSFWAFLWPVLLTTTFGCSKLVVDLLVLFCPNYYPEHGILLEQCDLPSIFQAVKFSFIVRTRNTFVGQFFEVGTMNGTMAATT